MKKGLKMKEEYKILNDMGYTNDKIDTLLSLGYTIEDILKINRKTNIINSIITPILVVTIKAL